jgi:2-polyprenyl-6-methoxyphenol hydroxylase-like FAD-dependent oxidoreductase
MRVSVIGAGIGGLAAALSLHEAGIAVDVYEAVAELKPLGVGINLLPHAVRELTELGLAERVAAKAIPTSALVYANRFGQEIWREPRGLAAGYRWPQYSIHRGRLQMLLLEAARERGCMVHLDHRLNRVEEDGMAHFTSANGSSRAQVRADLIIAADGIHSTARAQFYPDEGPPIWNRRVLWRGLSESDPYLGGATMVMAGHQDQKFVCYPIDPETRARGRSLVNWIAELKIPGDADWSRREDWNRRANPGDFLPQFRDWHFGWLDVPRLIEGSEAIYEYPMVDRDPIPCWTFGRVTLLGDAAHAMYPIGSNGASQAILDARHLAQELSRHDVDTALARYEAVRRPATAELVLLNRANGPEQVMQTAHERAPDGFKHIHDVMGAAELQATAGNYKRAAGFEVDALNARASLSPNRRNDPGL